MNEYVNKQVVIDALKDLEFCLYMEYREDPGESGREVWVIRAEKAQHTLQTLPPEDVIKVVRCSRCEYWNRETLRHQSNDFREWNEAECTLLAERDWANEINRYTEADDYCSYGNKRFKEE